MCIGNALVDLLGEVDDTFLTENTLIKSSMILCEKDVQKKLLSKLVDPEIKAGGSAANTASTISLLGLNTGFIGTIADDKWGLLFFESMRKIGITPYLHVEDSDSLSGTSVILITPDRERTMNTHLGVASNIYEENIPHEEISTSKLLYIEGYTFDLPHQKQAVLSAINTAANSDCKVSLTLSDTFCVERHKSDFLQIIEKVDILFCNQNEYIALYETSIPENKSDLNKIEKQLPPITVITQSENGATAIVENQILSFPANTNIDIIDLTGAGDQFAAGFIYGYLNKYEVKDCMKLAINLASKVITQIGPRLDEDIKEIREYMNGANA